LVELAIPRNAVLYGERVAGIVARLWGRRRGRGGSVARRDEVDLHALQLRELPLEALALRLRLSSKNLGSCLGGSHRSLLRRLRDGGGQLSSTRSSGGGGGGFLFFFLPKC